MRFLWVLCVSAALWGAPADGVAPAESKPVDGIVPAENRVALPPLEQLQMDALSYVEAQASALSGNYTFKVTKVPVLPRVPAGGKLSFEPSHLSRRELGGAFFASFNLKLDGRPLGMIRVDMEGKWAGKLLRAQTALQRKTVPEPGQFEQVSFEGNPPAGSLSEIPSGYRLRSPMASGHILVMQDLETIPVVAAGDQVRLEMVSGALVIAVEATARSNGAVGEKVRLEMPTSHKLVQAVVTGPGEARVQWAGGN
jgi:flagella basal body P-ring formation protein FlgA